ncbi:hypothetical protein BKA70DRAFT_1240994 [Coprinopsis sp. MPI-PUGE-AT-0042]|nr:hypothetical protein BKA70DRAFT_1240994 [Coprinopsis sp. MPI-PUGE-AT-0042]
MTGDATQVLNDRVSLELIKWGLPAAETLRLLRQTNSVISGSFALKAVLASDFMPGDIDIYCPRGCSEGILLFLKENGYEEEINYKPGDSLNATTIVTEGGIEGDNHYDSADTGIEEIHLLIHPDTGMKINIITSCMCSALIPILLFHSTLLMNWISQDGIICLYPELTMVKRGLQNEFPARDKTRKALLKYRERGFQILSEWHDLDESETSLSAIGWGHVRTMGDPDVLFVPFCEGSTSLPGCFEGIKWRLAVPEGASSIDGGSLRLREGSRPDAWITRRNMRTSSGKTA